MGSNVKMLRQFWSFVSEREHIRLRRLRGERPPWTDDPILATYSFTNVKREHDRTTTLLKREFYDEWVVGRKLYPAVDAEAWLNAAIFRYFGTIEFARAIGWSSAWTPERRAEIRSIAAKRDLFGETMFTGAYIVPAAGRSEPKYEIVLEIIDGIAQKLPRILDTNSWASWCHELASCYGCGSFMAKEICLDYVLATGEKPDDWQTWTPVGPGARRGAAWVRDGEMYRGLDEYSALQVCREIYATRDDPQSQFWSHEIELDLTDIQFQLCEFDKYMRAKTGAGKPKRKFRPTIDEITRRMK